jgi:hypothetical protein
MVRGSNSGGCERFSLLQKPSISVLGPTQPPHVGIGSLHSRGVALTTNAHPSPRLSLSRAILLLPLRAAWQENVTFSEVTTLATVCNVWNKTASVNTSEANSSSDDQFITLIYT